MGKRAEVEGQISLEGAEAAVVSSQEKAGKRRRVKGAGQEVSAEVDKLSETSGAAENRSLEAPGGVCPSALLGINEPRPQLRGGRRVARAASSGMPMTEAPGSVCEIVREYGPAVVLKMAQMACDGEVRAAALMFKLLEKEEPEAGGEALAQFTGALSGVERTVAGEILSLLGEQGESQ